MGGSRHPMPPPRPRRGISWLLLLTVALGCSPDPAMRTPILQRSDPVIAAPPIQPGAVDEEAEAAAPIPLPDAPAATPSAIPTTPVLPTPARAGDVVTGIGEPHGPGLTMFRGNPTRTWYGRGPVPDTPRVAWRHPRSGSLCSDSTVAGTTTRWCGTGWTGQPIVWERPDGRREVIVGAYDRQVHFLDADTGVPVRPPFLTGDLIKGTVTLDPDGYPLLYVGSRDNRYRIIALDRDVPTELFALTPHPDGRWNNDWDANAIITDGLLLQGGEDSWFRVVELRRGWDADGQVVVDPAVLVEVPGFDEQLLDDLPDNNVSIESSPLLVGDTVYVVNSGGLITGWRLSNVRQGLLPRTFRYWLGDDADATMVATPEGLIVAAVEVERHLARSDEVGQLVALDPSAADPLVWSVPIPPGPGSGDGIGGVWSTPALHAGHLYVLTHAGELLVVETASGRVVHREPIGFHEWSSPVVVDDTLVIGTCEDGGLRAFDLRDPARPEPTWTVTLGGCVESTPAVWDGAIWVGSRDGAIYRLDDDGSTP